VQWTPAFALFLLYIFCIITYRLNVGTAAMVGSIACLPLQRDRIVFPKLLVALGLLTLWCAFGFSRSVAPDVTWEAVMLMGKLWLVTFVGVNVLRSRSQIRFFILFSLGWFAAYPIRGALKNYYVDQYALAGRAIWNYIYNNPNDLAAICLLELAVTLAFLQRAKGWPKIPAFVGVALLPFVVILTQSRGALIALGVFCIAGLAMHRRNLRVMATVIVIAVVAVMLAPADVWDRMSGLGRATSVSGLNQVDTEGSARQRFEIWRVASTIAAEEPIFGVGSGAYPIVHQIVAQRPQFDRTAAGARDAHSTYLVALAETGIPGLILFLAVFVVTVWETDRVRRQCRKTLPRTSLEIAYLELGLLALFIAGIWGSYTRLTFTYLHLLLLASVAAAARKELATTTQRVERSIFTLSIPERRRAGGAVAIAHGKLGGP
jgi:probable O-glycosylation ligase (exosortase A-associated)